MIFNHGTMEEREYEVNTIKGKAEWVELELIDEDGNPLSNEEYILILPDGKQRKGALDNNGRAAEKNIPPGEIKIQFPKLEEVDLEEKNEV